MNKTYETPQIDLLEVAVEQGIATTTEPGMDNMPFTPWDL